MSDLQITSIDDLLRLVDDWSRRFKFQGEIGYPAIWYRGQSRLDWKLRPGILRDDFIELAKKIYPSTPIEIAVLILEATLNRRFRSMGASLLPSGCALVDVYFLAQHHGFRTRLLDWTSNPLAALYFAVESERNKNRDGALYVIHPGKLILGEHRKSNLLLPPLTPHDSYLRERIERLFDLQHGDDMSEDPFIIPVLPDQRAGRLYQQGSCFTYHGFGTRHLDDFVGEWWLEKYIIPQTSKAYLLRTLRRLNVTRATLFHDLDSVSAEIIGAYGLSAGAAE